MRVDFARNSNRFPPIEINGKPLEVVDEAKLLGLTITSNLKWNSHVKEHSFKKFKTDLSFSAVKTSKSFNSRHFAISFCLRSPYFGIRLDSLPLFHTKIPK